ncbi:MAG: hypothetical protein ACR2Q4_01565 [Geminicoccaceae bacterium]
MPPTGALRLSGEQAEALLPILVETIDKVVIDKSGVNQAGLLIYQALASLIRGILRSRLPDVTTID